MTDLILSGVFTLSQGRSILECIDSYILFGKRDESLLKNINTIYEEYIIQMKHTDKVHSDLNVTLSEIIANLNKKYKSFDINDRYISIMDSVRKILFKSLHLPKKKARPILHLTEKKEFNTRSRHKKIRTPTVISESTNVNSVFSRTFG
tara:strand:+ start:1334 stop:1780 length:447 start_codon:yes stop_codon:yes gene_type:complete